MARGTAHAPAEARRSEILDAALACFGERGYHETTVDQIAGRAGLSKGAVYWHFEAKREIFLALFDRFVDALVTAQAEATRATTAAEGLLRFAHLGLLEVANVVPLMDLSLEYMAHASRDQALRERFQTLYAGLSGPPIDLVERGIADGSFRRVDPEVVARTLIALGDGLLMQAIALPDLDLPRAVRDCFELVLKGIEKP